MREVIQDGVNGGLTDFFSPQEIAEKVATCLEYPSFIGPIRQKARQAILDRFRLDRMLERKTGLIRHLMAQQPGAPCRFG